jgi:hypothetical protein
MQVVAPADDAVQRERAFGRLGVLEELHVALSDQLADDLGITEQRVIRSMLRLVRDLSLDTETGERR